MILETNFSDKYSPKTLENLPVNPSLITLFQNFIKINRIQLLLISEDEYLKLTIIKLFIKTLAINQQDMLFTSKIRDQGVTNMRYEIKMFCQSPSKYGKKLLVIDDIHIFSESIQKLFVNNIDKWSKNLHVLVTTNNIYSVDEILVTRLFPINIPSVSTQKVNDMIKYICDKEELNISNTSQELISLLSQQNIQNVYHVLEKCRLLQAANIEITSDIIKKCSTLINFDMLEQYFIFCKNGDVLSGYNHLLKIIDNGHSVLDILNEISNYSKISDILNEEQKYKCCKIVSQYIVVFITIHEEELELLLFTQEFVDIF
jgi:DNA polymerase III gamma/tau subunit